MLEIGLIGGGAPDAFFGSVHRRAIGLAGMQVAATVLSSNPKKSVEYGKAWGVPRPYGTLKTFLKGEVQRGQNASVM